MAENFIDGAGDTPISWYMFEEVSSPFLDGNTTNANNLAWSAPTARDAAHIQGSYSAYVATGRIAIQYPQRGLSSLSANFPFKAATTAFTFGGWVLCPLNMDISRRFACQFVTTSGWLFTADDGTPSRIRAGLWNTTTLPSNATVYNDGNWHHLVLRWNGDNRAGAGVNDELSFWIDGTKQSTTQTPSSVVLVTDSAAEFAFPGDSVVHIQYDEWFFFNLALQDTQISDVYAHGLNGTRDVFIPSGLAAVDGDERYFPKFKLQNPITAGRVI